MFAQRDSQRYFLGIGGYLREGAIGKNNGEWRIMVEKKHSVWERVRGANKLTEDDPILAILDQILHEQADIHNIRREIASP